MPWKTEVEIFFVLKKLVLKGVGRKIDEIRMYQNSVSLLFPKRAEVWTSVIILVMTRNVLAYDHSLIVLSGFTFADHIWVAGTLKGKYS